MNTEQAVIASVIIDSSLMDEIELRPDDFNEPFFANVWRQMLQMRDDRQPIDLITVADAFPTRRNDVFRITEGTLTGAAATFYARQVSEAATLRRILILAQTLVSDASSKSSDELLDFAKNSIDRLSLGGAEIQTLSSLFGQVIEEVQNPAPMIPSAFKGLNKLIGGYRNGAMYVVAARPGVGKTIFALQTAFDLAEKGGVLFFSMEMGAAELMKRLMSSVSSVEAEKIMAGSLPQAELNRIDSNRGKFERNLFIQDRSAISATIIRSTFRKLNRVNPIRAIVIDYLGLMSDTKGGKGRYEKVTNISNDLKQLARELNVPVIALHQLNREIESRADPKPTLSDLRDSGAIEQDADVVMLLHRESEMGRYTNLMKVFVSKNRHGSQGLCELTIHPDYVRVVENA